MVFILSSDYLLSNSKKKKKEKLTVHHLIWDMDYTAYTLVCQGVYNGFIV